jgi:enamine deaminase RidA (YjgF/YER057c/UK114 family)
MKVIERKKSMSQSGQVQYVNPDTLNKNPAFTNVVVVTGSVKTVYVGGQDAVDSSGKIVGKGDIKAQTEQVLKNIQTALAAGGAEIEHIVKWNLFVVQGQSLQAGFEAFQQFWGMRPNPPLISFVFVSGLANPDFLVEMDAIAVVPQ